MPELLDIRDKHGSLTGETMFRTDVHQSEAWHGVVLVCVYNSKGEILLQLRAAHLNAFPEKWDISVSGHITAGDKPLQTAVRELSEELGIYAKPEELLAVGEVADTYLLVYGKTHHEYDYIFLVKQDIEISELKLQAAEVLEVRWITPDQLERDLADPIVSHRYSKRGGEVYRRIIEAVRVGI